LVVLARQNVDQSKISDNRGDIVCEGEMRNIRKYFLSAAGQSVDVKQMFVEGNLDGVSRQR